MGVNAVVIFCGSSKGAARYQAVTRELGKRLPESEIALVYGGGNIGLMGVLADAVLNAGGEVIGVIPQFLIDWEVAHRGLTKLITVDSMHERKAKMAELADAFVALPGGFGTLEEFFEALTWLQLGLHSKPCIILNAHDFYTPLLSFLDSAHREGYISKKSMDLITVCNTVDGLMALLESHSGESGFAEKLS